MAKTLIIGASRGLGFEFAKQLIERGEEVSATCRNTQDLDKLNLLGAHTHLLDLTVEESVQEFESALETDCFDLIVHNAGVFGSRERTSSAPSREVFDHVMVTNVLGPMRLIPQLAALLAAKVGKYVFISSDMASIEEAQSSGGSLYRASKAALNMTMRCASLDFEEVKFLALSPGWVRTDMGGEDAPLSPQQSVAGMLHVIQSLESRPSGQFRDYADRRLPW